MHASCSPTSFWGQSHSARENVFTVVIALYKVIFWFSRFWLQPWRNPHLLHHQHFSLDRGISWITLPHWVEVHIAWCSQKLSPIWCDATALQPHCASFQLKQPYWRMSGPQVNLASRGNFPNQPKPFCVFALHRAWPGALAGGRLLSTRPDKAHSPAADGDGKLPGKRLHGITKMPFIYLFSDMRLWPCLWGQNPDTGWT